MVFQRLIERFIKHKLSMQEQRLKEAYARIEPHIWMAEKISEAEAVTLEKSLELDPKNLRTRALLIGYWGSSLRGPNAQKCIAQKLWIIENEPHSPLVKSCDINEILSPAAYEDGKRLWLQHVDSLPNDPWILKQAADYFLYCEEEIAEKLILTGKAVTPRDPQWSSMLATLHSHSSKSKDPIKAFKAQEEAYKLARSNLDKLTYLEALPAYALKAGELKLAKRYAERLLKCGAKEDESIKSDCTHKAFTTLGRLNLLAHNIEAAKECLLKSAEVKGSGVLNSFGPSFALAEELFDANEREVVLEYLKLCSKFWFTGQINIDEWSDKIKNGQLPDEFRSHC